MPYHLANVAALTASSATLPVAVYPGVVPHTPARYNHWHALGNFETTLHLDTPPTTGALQLAFDVDNGNSRWEISFNSGDHAIYISEFTDGVAANHGYQPWGLGTGDKQITYRVLNGWLDLWVDSYHPISTDLHSKHVWGTNGYINQSTTGAIRDITSWRLDATGRRVQPLLIGYSDVAARLEAELVQQGLQLFLHDNMITFTTGGWAPFDIDPNTWAPNGRQRTDQWAQLAKVAGAKGVVLTAKHHDGFCIWNTDYIIPGMAAPYSSEVTSWYSNYHQDTLASLAADCYNYGLDLGIYFSIWDRTLANRVVIPGIGNATSLGQIETQLVELLTRYGPVKQMWFDAWQTMSGFSVHSWEHITGLIHNLQPTCLVLQNGHVHPATNSQIETYESGEGMPAVGNTRLSQYCEPVRFDGYWFYDPACSQLPSAILSPATVKANLAYLQANASCYLLDYTPDRDGKIPDTQAAQLAALAN